MTKVPTRSAYYDSASQSWVRMEKQEDGEYCHTSGYATKEEALAEDKDAENDE